MGAPVYSADTNNHRRAAAGWSFPGGKVDQTGSGT